MGRLARVLLAGMVLLAGLPSFSFSKTVSQDVSDLNFAYISCPTTTFTYGAGRIRKDNSLVTIGSGTVTLTGSISPAAPVMNYIEVNQNGAVSANQTGFTFGSIPLYQVYYSGSNVPLSPPIDCRSFQPLDFISGVENITVDRTLVKQEQAGKIITNFGAGAARTYTLPPCSIGTTVTVVRNNATFNLCVRVSGSDTIVGTTNNAQSSGAQGSSITLVGISPTQWVRLMSTGTWTDTTVIP